MTAILLFFYNRVLNSLPLRLAAAQEPFSNIREVINIQWRRDLWATIGSVSFCVWRRRRSLAEWHNAVILCESWSQDFYQRPLGYSLWSLNTETPMTNPQMSVTKPQSSLRLYSSQVDAKNTSVIDRLTREKGALCTFLLMFHCFFFIPLVLDLPVGVNAWDLIPNNFICALFGG